MACGSAAARISIRSQSNSRTRSLGSGPGLVKAGEWNHVAVSWGNSGFRLYLNGQKVDEDTSWKAGWVDNQESILIGADNQFSDSQRTDKPEFFFNGKLDDVALYNRALSGADIARLFDGNGGGNGGDPAPEPSNLAPLAQDNNYQVEQGKPLSVNATQGVLLNDSDPDGDVLSAVASNASTAQGGQIVLATNGSFNYTPPAGFSGIDQFDYSISDGRGGSSTATVEIEVTATPSPDPVSTQDSLASTYNPVSHWQLSESSGTVAADSEGLSKRSVSQRRWPRSVWPLYGQRRSGSGVRWPQ